MSVIIFFSESKQLFFCRNDVQALDFLRKGSYAPDKAHFSIGKKNKRSTKYFLFHNLTFYSIMIYFFIQCTFIFNII